MNICFFYNHCLTYKEISLKWLKLTKPVRLTEVTSRVHF